MSQTRYTVTVNHKQASSSETNSNALFCDERLFRFRPVRLRITCPWFHISIIHSNYLKGMRGHTASWKTCSVVTFCDVIVWQWWRRLELQPQISGRENLCLELLRPSKPLLPADWSTWKNTWRDNEENPRRLCENIAIFLLNMCLAEQRRTAVNLMRVIFQLAMIHW